MQNVPSTKFGLSQARSKMVTFMYGWQGDHAGSQAEVQDFDDASMGLVVWIAPNASPDRDDIAVSGVQTDAVARKLHLGKLDPLLGGYVKDADVVRWSHVGSVVSAGNQKVTVNVCGATECIGRLRKEVAAPSRRSRWSAFHWQREYAAACFGVPDRAPRPSHDVLHATMRHRLSSVQRDRKRAPSAVGDPLASLGVVLSHLSNRGELLPKTAGKDDAIPGREGRCEVTFHRTGFLNWLPCCHGSRVIQAPKLHVRIVTRKLADTVEAVLVLQQVDAVGDVLGDRHFVPDVKICRLEQADAPAWRCGEVKAAVKSCARQAWKRLLWRQWRRQTDCSPLQNQIKTGVTTDKIEHSSSEGIWIDFHGLRLSHLCAAIYKKVSHRFYSNNARRSECLWLARIRDNDCSSGAHLWIMASTENIFCRPEILLNTEVHKNKPCSLIFGVLGRPRCLTKLMR